MSSLATESRSTGVGRGPGGAGSSLHFWHQSILGRRPYARTRGAGQVHFTSHDAWRRNQPNQQTNRAEKPVVAGSRAERAAALAPHSHHAAPLLLFVLASPRPSRASVAQRVTGAGVRVESGRGATRIPSSDRRCLAVQNSLTSAAAPASTRAHTISQSLRLLQHFSHLHK